MTQNSDDRRSERVPVALEIEFRSAGAFLVAYSTNLSKGGLFLETATPLPVGTQLELTLHAPDATAIELVGVVAWVREQDEGEGQPVGMGIQLETLESRYGDVVDEIVHRFSGIRIWVASGGPAQRGTLHRYLRSILACEIVEADLALGVKALSEAVDLAVIDLDACGLKGEEWVQDLRERPTTASVPVIVLAKSEEQRRRALALGAQGAIPNPPQFGDLQSVVMRTLARPSAVR